MDDMKNETDPFYSPSNQKHLEKTIAAYESGKNKPIIKSIADLDTMADMITYQIANQEQLPQLLELYKQLQPSEEPLSMNTASKIWQKIEQHDIKCFIAMENGKIIASCYLAVIPNLTRQGQSIGFIENVITDQNYRKHGIGKKLLDMATDYAKTADCYKVLLQSGYKRRENHVFYEKCGFDGNSKRAFEKRF